MFHGGIVEIHCRGAVMSEIATIGLDRAKTVFQLHGADRSGKAVLRKKPRRDQVLAFLSTLPPCAVAMEACGGAHFRGREIGNLGHEVHFVRWFGLAEQVPGTLGLLHNSLIV